MLFNAWIFCFAGIADSNAVESNISVLEGIGYEMTNPISVKELNQEKNLMNIAGIMYHNIFLLMK